jgi:hypothetical protein
MEKERTIKNETEKEETIQNLNIKKYKKGRKKKKTNIKKNKGGGT